jgi:LAO/AO transport system kinase
LTSDFNMMKVKTVRSAGWADEVRAGSVRHAARLITAVENGDPAARPVLRELGERRGRAQIIGVTGPPGAGKSSLVAAMIRALRDGGRTVGVVAVDPSSPFSGGALLGDRDRMLEASAGDPGVFIRSVAARGAQGGLAAAVDDAVDILDAMGKDVVIVETVGVGQGELEIASLAHTVLLVLVPGYGDSLQAMKAGITEIADVVAVNKADTPGADSAAKELRGHGYERRNPLGGDPWPVPVHAVSALRQDGVGDLVTAIDEHFAFLGSTGWRAQVESRRQQTRFVAFVQDRLRQDLLSVVATAAEGVVLTDPYGAAEEYVERLLKAQSALDPASSEGSSRALPGEENR